jgi:hypothetical protein
MPIEFNCTQCGKQLRTPDETAGRNAKCPQCGAIMQIPNFSGPAPQQPPPAFGPSPGQQAGASPFGSPPPQADQAGWNPYASPNIGGQSAEHRQAAAGEIIPTRVDLGYVLSATWAIFRANLGICLLAGLTWCVVYIVVAVITNAIQTALDVGFNFGGAGVPRNFNLGAVIAAQLLTQLISWVVLTWLQLGAIRCFLKIARGQPASVGDVFTGGPFLFRGLLINLVFFVTVFVGVVIAMAALAAAGVAAFFAILIGLGILNVVIYLGLAQAQPLVIDRNMSALDSIKMSMQVMSGNKLMLFLLLLVVGILGAIFGFVTCFIGFIAVVPYSFLMLAVFYLQATGQPTVEMRQPGMYP